MPPPRPPPRNPRPALERRLHELVARGTRIATRLRTSPEGADAEVLQALDDEVRAEEVAVRRALGSIDAGTYGTCEHCHHAIPAERLGALPTASTCARCAS